MRKTLSALLLVAGVAAWAQSPGDGVPKFEVASIKRCQELERGGGRDAPSPGRMALNCLTTYNLIRMAYLVFPTGQPNAPVSATAIMRPISGGPAWIDSERYRVDAKADSPANSEMMKGPMLQALSQERFKLQVHWEAKEIGVFELTVGKSGPKLRLAKADGCVVSDRNLPAPAPEPVYCGLARKSSGGGFDIPGVTMADLCRELAKYVDRDIVDKTGITGVFDVHLELAPVDLGYPDAAPDLTSTYTPGDGRAIAAAVEKIGLQMRPAKGSVQFLVIDHVDRPSEN